MRSNINWDFKRVWPFDLNAASSGFLYALSVANQFIQTGTYKNILVIGAETLHPVIDYQDPNTCILFGDGAGAIVVTRANPEESSTVLGYHALSDGAMGLYPDTLLPL